MARPQRRARRWARSDEYNSDFLVRVYNAVAGQLGVSVPATPGEPAPEEVGSEESSTEEVDVPRPVPPSVAPQLVQEPGSTDAVTGSVDARRLQQVLNADETEIRVAISLLEPADLLPSVLGVAQTIAGNAPLSIRQAKKSVRFGMQMELQTALRFEAETYDHLVDTADRLEGVAAFNEKRKPRFIGR